MRREKTMSAGAPIPDFTLPYTSQAIGGQNGRVNFAIPSAGTANQLTPSVEETFKHPTQITSSSYGNDLLRGNIEQTAVSKAFFSVENLNYLQSQIQREVYVRSGPKKYRIDPQDVDEVQMIMRGMFLQYARNNPFDIKGQVDELNKWVIDWSVPRIMSEIDQHLYYLKDISHMPIPLQQPMNMSSAGTRSLPYNNFM